MADMNKTIRLTEDLIRFESDRNNKKSREDIIRFVIDYIKKNSDPKNLKNLVFEEPIHNGIKSLYVYTKGNNKGLSVKDNADFVLLLGHLDVIPADKKDFSPKHDNKFIYGRASGDMKSGVAVLMELFLKYPEKTRILLTTDEEIGGFNGACILSEKIKPRLVLVTEPTENRVCIQEKGGLWVDISIKGPGGHSSRPWFAKNCVDVLIKILDRLRAEFPNPEKESWTDTMNIGAIQGGKLDIRENKIINGPANSIADNASVRLDFRITEKTEHDDVINLIRKILDEEKKKLASGYDINLVIVEKVSHLRTSPDDLDVKRFLKAHQSLYGNPEMKQGHAASDGRFFSEKKIPVILFGPISIGHHSNGEKADILSVEKTYDLLDKFLGEK